LYRRINNPPEVDSEDDFWWIQMLGKREGGDPGCLIGEESSRMGWLVIGVVG
jgi:hypothetical protein